MVVDGSRYESGSIREAFLAYSNLRINALLVMHKLINALDEGKDKNKGRTKARPCLNPGPCSSAVVQRVAEFVYN